MRICLNSFFELTDLIVMAVRICKPCLAMLLRLMSSKLDWAFQKSNTRINMFPTKAEEETNSVLVTYLSRTYSLPLQQVCCLPV